MKKHWSFLRLHWRLTTVSVVAVAFVVFLLLFRLGSLVHGLSGSENAVAVTPIGWHGLYHQPLNLPLDFVRSVDFKLFAHHGQTLTRLPNAIFGFMAVVGFAWLLRIWHGTRTAIFGTALFACAAWTLHVSRLASFDVLYLWAMTTLLVTYALLQRHSKRAFVLYVAVAAWGLLLYVPGMVWLVCLTIWLQRREIADGWRSLGNFWRRAGYVCLGLIWLPLLILAFFRSPAVIKTWLGLPQTFAAPLTLLKHFAGVFVHLFIRGPEYPYLWLGRAPLLDAFVLAACLLGLYFYARHWRAARSQLLFISFLVAAVLIALGGPVSLSLAVPLLYVWAAAGIAYLLHEWLKVFPFNPLARSLGIGLIIIAVVFSCAYNLRAYFIAWPHDPTTAATFPVRR